PRCIVFVHDQQAVRRLCDPRRGGIGFPGAVPRLRYLVVALMVENRPVSPDFVTNFPRWSDPLYVVLVGVRKLRQPQIGGADVPRLDPHVRRTDTIVRGPSRASVQLQIDIGRRLLVRIERFELTNLEWAVGSNAWIIGANRFLAQRPAVRREAAFE